MAEVTPTSPDHRGGAGSGSTPVMTWFNHASFMIETGDAALLTDPWFDGRIFDGGWVLLVPTVHQPRELVHVNHLWVSHEHPDTSTRRHCAPCWMHRAGRQLCSTRRSIVGWPAGVRTQASR